MSAVLLPPQKTTRRNSAHTSTREKEMAEIKAMFSPRYLTRKTIDWTVLLWMIGIHLGCLLAPFYFSWPAVAVCVVMYWLTGSIGICLGYHRYLSHRSLKLAAPAKFFVLLCGALSGQGSPLRWAATHRLHHGHSDHEGDPHSPFDGRLWSHMTWLFTHHNAKQNRMVYERFIPDLLKDRMLLFFERTYGPILVLTGVVLYVLGGLPMLIWGLCVRMTLAYHGTWFVNSATHLWGYRTYPTDDESKNLWWVALITHGEGWHNNHHAHPHLARAGHKWWEFDTTFMMIRLLQVFRLASDVKDGVPNSAAHA